MSSDHDACDQPTPCLETPHPTADATVSGDIEAPATSSAVPFGHTSFDAGQSASTDAHGENYDGHGADRTQPTAQTAVT